MVQYASMAKPGSDDSMMPPMILSKPMLPDLPFENKFSDFVASSLPYSGMRQFETVKTMSAVSTAVPSQPYREIKHLRIADYFSDSNSVASKAMQGSIMTAASEHKTP